VVRETQKWGEFSFILCSQKFSFALRLCICSHVLCMAAGEGIASPTGRDIDGRCLDMNEKDLKNQYAKFQNDWPIFGVSLMCDSWTGPTRMSVINFLIYFNGVTWFQKC
jgi:hypothetical protein